MDRSCIESWHSQISDMSDVCFICAYIIIYICVCVWGDTMRHTCWCREFWQSWGFAWYFPFWGLTLGWEKDLRSRLRFEPKTKWDTLWLLWFSMFPSSCEKNMEFGLRPVGRQKPHCATKNTDGVARSGRMWKNGGTWDAMMVPNGWQTVI